MSGILPLQIKPTPNIGTVYDPTVQIGVAAQQLQLKQQQDAADRQNALMGIFRDPKSLDGTGNPTPETMQKIMAVDPQVGMTVRQNMMIGQQRQLQTEALKSGLMEKKMDMIGSSVAPIMETYETEVRSGVPEPQARRNAQAALVQANQRLMDSGIFGEDDKKRFPTEFEPNQIRNVVAGTKQYQDWLKQQRADTEEARKQRHDDEMNANKNTELLQDNQGRPFTWRPNAPEGKKAVYADGSAVPEDRLKDVKKVGAGGTSAAAERQKDDDTIAAFERGGEHTPEQTEAYQAAIARRKAQADRAATVAGASTGARQAITAKPTSVLINGKPGLAVWRNGQWVGTDGQPVQGEVRLAGKPPAQGSPAAEKQARFEEMKQAQQEAGTYKDDTTVYRALDKQMAEDKQTAISDDAATIAAQVALKTGHPPAWMGRSQASLTKFLDKYAEEAKRQKLGADEIAANIAKFSGEMAEARTLGTSSARIDFAAKELDVALPTALEASERVWRPGFKKLAELQQAVKGQTSDPDLLEFAQFNQQVMSAYSAAMQRGGASTVHAMERAEHLLSTATSQAGYMRQLDTLHKEVQTILYGTQAAKLHLRAEITGSPEITEPPQLTGVPRPATPPPVQVPDALKAARDAGHLYSNADGTVIFNKDDGKYYDKAGKEIPAPGAAKPAEAKPAEAPKPAETKPIPLRKEMKESDLENGKTYDTPRGLAVWNSATKQFTPVKGP
jgi:hypothetical protein